MSSRHLPDRPSLEFLKKQAKQLLADALPGTKLVDVQHDLARDHGFASWPKLKAYVESLAGSGDPFIELAAAVRAGDTRRAADVLRRHPVVKARLDDPLPEDEFGATPLLHAVYAKNRAMIDLLLEAGADINQRSHWWAGSFGVLDAREADADYLIGRGARLDAHAAARLGRLDDLRRLVAAKPDVVHARGGDGQTPLHFAANVEVARFLLEHGADIDARCVDHESTPAQWMIDKRQDVVRYLVERGCATDLLMLTALGDLPRVKRCLEEHPDHIGMRVSREWFPRKNPRAAAVIYQWTLNGEKNALRVARDFGRADVERFLLERSADTDRLAFAAETGDQAAVSALLRAEPGLVGKLSRVQQQGLITAAEKSDLVALRTLLAAGWPVDVADDFATTALHWAGFHGNVAIIKELLAHHAPVDVPERQFGGTPLHWAIYGSVHSWHCKTGDYPLAVRTLIEAGARPPALSEVRNATDAVREVLLRYA